MEKKTLFRLKVLFILFLFPCFVISQVSEIYSKKCSGCHGMDLSGTPAGSSLLESNLRYGNSQFALSKVIENGVEGSQMIGWKGLLKKSEIDSLSEYILTFRKQVPNHKVNWKSDIILTNDYKLKIEKVIGTGINHPWGIDFVDDQLAFISGNRGELYQIVDGKLDDSKIKNLPEVYAYDMVGGMMDIILDPNYTSNGWIYLSFSHTPTGTKDPNAPGMTKIVRGKVKNNHWVDEETLFEASDSILVKGGKRWGSRFLFDRKGLLYFTIGDMQQSIQYGNNPQLAYRAEGKIFRINPDGSIPRDNPLRSKKNVLPSVFAWGTRNVQGLAQHPTKDMIYFTDHGPRGGDEINILKKGANYGWPIITYGLNYNKTVISPLTEKEGMEQPIHYYDPSIAICAAEFVTGELFKKWNNDLLITALKEQELRRIRLIDNRIIEEEILLKGFGRVRDVKIGPNGALWVLTNKPDQLLKLTPMP